MENKSHAFATGLFTILLGLAIVVTLLWLRRDTTDRLPYDVVTRGAVTGLAANAPVRYRGLLVGRVQSIGFDPVHSQDIVIRIMVDKKTPITHATEASLGLQGVTGLAFLQLDERSNDAPLAGMSSAGGTTSSAAAPSASAASASASAAAPAATAISAQPAPGAALDRSPLPTSPDHVARIPMRAGLIEQLERRGQALVAQMTVISGNLARWTNDDTRQQMLATMTSIRHAADGVSTLTKNAAPAMQHLPQTMANLDQTLQSANHLMTNLNRPDGPLIANLNRIGVAAERGSNVLADISAKVRYDTLPHLDALSENVDAAARSITRAADLVSEHPRSLLFGTPAPPPGPGESGFAWPGSQAGSANAQGAADTAVDDDQPDGRALADDHDPSSQTGRTGQTNPPGGGRDFTRALTSGSDAGPAQDGAQ